MDKRQSQQLTQQLFTQPFELESYRNFLRNLLNQFEPRDGHYTGNDIPDAFKMHVNQYWRIGKYVDPDGNELDLLVVEVKSLTKLERARSALRNFAVDRLKKFDKEASLIAFYAQDDAGADWRFSFVKIEHEAYKDDKGKVKLKQELTPAKRHSFLVGVHENSHTACKQLLPVLTMDYADPRIEEIEAAFSIEKVTDEFFDQYKALFQKLGEQLKKQRFFKCASEEETDQGVSRFAKKLLGQIVFLYFLQKKGWMGAAQGQSWGEGSKRFMRERYEQIATAGGSYYHDFLQYLFYEALACERKGQADLGYYQRFKCRVPFLNGGLFEADYDWQNETIDLPNSLFHNDEKTKAGDVGTGILDVFDRYNFTIKEDEPLDKEVAVDPEMLGKVFENMLEVTERKSKGAFYTPREIVHYMCQESLIHYLDNRFNNYAETFQPIDSEQPLFFGALSDKKGQPKLEIVHQDGIRVPKEELETLIRKGHLALENDTRVISKGKETEAYRFQLPEAVRNHAKEIDAALADIKVCDPAIGSGAFPVGLLHEIVNARLVLAPLSGNDSSAYDLKRHAIAESIYGVDIDASAIDIARLRLWLSLIVDEEDYGTIEALPNLDYKIVRGDSLIGFPENWQSPAADRIEDLKKQFFAETDHDHKAELKAQIDDEIRTRMAGSKRVFGYKVEFDFRLFFSEVWHSKGGFDVVIGNPPYMIIQTITKAQPQLVKVYKERYSAATGKFDIYCLFVEKGLELINSQGALNFIMPIKWISSGFGVGLRSLVSKKRNLLRLISFDSYQVFNASTYTSLIWLSGKPVQTAEFSKLEKELKTEGEVGNWLRRQVIKPIEIAMLGFDKSPWSFPTENGSEILTKIRKYPPIQDLLDGVYQGVVTGDNDAFWIHNCKIIDGFIHGFSKATNSEIEIEQELVHPLLYGKTVSRHQIKFNDTYLLYPYEMKNGKTSLIPEKDLQNKFPKAYSYLKNIKDRLSSRGSSTMNYPSWYSLWNQREINRLSQAKKIITPDVCFGGSMAIDHSGHFFHADTTYAIIPDKKYEKLVNYLYSVLNSSIAWFYLVQTGSVQRGGYFRFKTSYIKPLPIPSINPNIHAIFDSLVPYQYIASSKLVSKFIDELTDALVFELYFPDEIKAAGKEILPHLGELTPITDSMSEEEKLAIIQREFDRLYDPHHPVRNHLETLDSVVVVRTIREALKR